MPALPVEPAVPAVPPLVLLPDCPMLLDPLELGEALLGLLELGEELELPELLGDCPMLLELLELGEELLDPVCPLDVLASGELVELPDCPAVEPVWGAVLLLLPELLV